MLDLYRLRLIVDKSFNPALAYEITSLIRPIFERTNGVDGWVSLEVSPLLAYDTQSTIAAAKELHARAERPNLFIKIPGTEEGLPAIAPATSGLFPTLTTPIFEKRPWT